MRVNKARLENDKPSTHNALSSSSTCDESLYDCDFADTTCISTHQRAYHLLPQHDTVAPPLITTPRANTKQTPSRSYEQRGNMASTFEPSMSTSRQNLAPHGPSMADQLPSIDFGFDALRERMSRFTVRFDGFIEQGRKRVLEERNQFRMNVAELQEDERMRKRDIEIMQVKSNSLQQTLAKEKQEKQEMEASIAALQSQRNRQEAERDALARQVADTQRAIDARVAAQQARARQREAQARFNVPELDFWVTNLCLSMEGAGNDDRLRFVFTHIDDQDWAREAWFELDTAQRDYAVRHCRPKLEREKVDGLLERVNESRELVVLLKGMRELFVEAMKSS
ncbi:kinetochore protein spc25 [Ophiostoma piceae UAMH 11346]|uniref:Kinetochore protein SPC25 n=1 Tax=Ophiostoma piceae (strain UAMH 11346) TaxID=1262450 RepID=S3D5U9_OPHP1|nr:kinetochore protein spc25 [Ophiostoma piceae UAMH 11346]